MGGFGTLTILYFAPRKITLQKLDALSRFGKKLRRLEFPISTYRLGVVAELLRSTSMDYSNYRPHVAGIEVYFLANANNPKKLNRRKIPIFDISVASFSETRAIHTHGQRQLLRPLPIVENNPI